MECLSPTVSFDIFIDNYFTSFRLLTHRGAKNIQKVCSTIIGYANALSLGTNSCKKKKERSHFEQRSAHLAKKQCNLCGWLERQQGGLHSFS